MKIIYADNDKTDLRRSNMVEGLIAYNNQFQPHENWDYAAFYAEDDQGTLLGGIHIHFEWDYGIIKHLWVAEPHKGIGSTLIAEAEKLARQKDKKGLWTDTLEFQARGFYEKNGFTLFGEIKQAAGDYARYFMIKLF
jgi:GNAT superfamily N-acetyltransferase